MSTGGRPKDAVWRHFAKVEIGGINRAKCHHCGTDLVPAPTRMKSHLEKCTPETSSSNVVVDLDASSEPVTPRRCQSTLNVVRTTIDEQKELDLQLARAIYSSNSPFSLVNNPHFRKYQTMMRPGVSFADRHFIGGEMLDRVYDEESTKAKGSFQNERASVILDGWSTRQNDSIIGATLFCNGDYVLLDLVDTTGHPHSIDYLVELCSKLLVQAQEEWKLTVIGIVTDNAYNMKGMREKMAELFPGVIVVGCHAHLANLLSKDVTERQADVVGRVTSVLKWFKNTHVGSAELRLQDYRALHCLLQLDGIL